MPVTALKDFLDKQSVKYVVITHSKAYTAQEIAESAHIPGRELAKTVMVMLDGAMAMAVVRATDKVDLDLLRGAAGAKSVVLASEREFQGLFPNCEPGAMPPFGNLYGMQVYVEEALTRDPQIAFNAGSHTELFRLSYKDFERLVKPQIANFSQSLPV